MQLVVPTGQCAAVVFPLVLGVGGRPKIVPRSRNDEKTLVSGDRYSLVILHKYVG